MHGRLRILAIILIILAPLLGAAGWYVHYELVERPATLAAAGPINLSSLETDVSIDTVTPAATGARNAAEFYLGAINHYNRRRAPFAQASKLYAFADEPPIEPIELVMFAQGAMQRDCDFYERSNSDPRFAFIIEPGDKRWPFEPVRDPYGMRPYVTPFRIFCIAALNEGKRMEQTGHGSEALRVYQSMARFGCHLRRRPGSMLDVQLGLELEMKGLHYLDVFYATTRNPSQRARVWAYGDALRKLAAEVSRKYEQLGNVEAAKRILYHDQDALWRMEAAAALHVAIVSEAYGWLENRSMRRALAHASGDADPRVREVALYLTDLYPARLHAPGPESVS